MQKQFNLRKEIVIAFILAGVICAIISAAINYFLVGMPDAVSTNTFNHALSGFMSGGISGIIGTAITAKKLR